MLDPTVYKDWQIAEAAEKDLPPVEEFRKMLGLLPEEIIPYGKTPKLDFMKIMERLKDKPDGKYIEVTAITPTPLGEGKSTTSAIDPRFGRAKYFIVYDDADKTWETIDNIQNLEAAQGAGIQSAATVVNAGCGVLISGHCGPKAFAALSKAGVAIYLSSGGTVAEALEAYRNGTLERIDNPDVEGHW